MADDAAREPTLSELMAAGAAAIRDKTGINSELLLTYTSVPMMISWSTASDPHKWPGCADDCTHPSHRDTHAEWRELNDDADR